MRLRSAATMAAMLVPFVLGCNEKAATSPRTDIITISPDQSNASLQAGGTSTVGLTITRPVGYTGAIALSTDGAPAGVTATLSPATLNPDVNQSTLRLQADAGTPSGSGAVTVRATGTGIDAQSATIQVTIGAVGSGSFTILANPSSITVGRGGSAAAAITIARSGYTGPVSLDVSGFPATIAASISPGTTSADAATLSIQIGTGTQTGTYTGVISAQGNGVAGQTATVSVTVLPSGIVVGSAVSARK